MPEWTTPIDIRVRVKRRWDDGTLLCALADGAAFPALEIPLRGPRPTELGDDLAAARTWIAELQKGSRGGARYDLEYAPVGGRHFGRNELPRRAHIRSYEQAFALLAVADQVHRFRSILDVVATEPDVRSWVAAHPLRALAAADSWPDLLAAYRWLREARGTLRYLREISAPGVDTKFVERHRPILAELLGVPTNAAGFVNGLGLRAKPELVRLRLDPTLGVAHGLTELTARREELAAIDLTITRALVVENEVTFLSVPVPRDGVVLWGKGFEVDRAGSMPWLSTAEVDYWGDLDTHGFAILNRLRAWLPQTRSVLMDRATLLAHRDRWVTETTPSSAALSRLDSDKHALYRDLVTDRFGTRVRLEQERIDWAWAMARLTR